MSIHGPLYDPLECQYFLDGVVNRAVGGHGGGHPQGIIGLFGLAGIAGVLVGRWADSGHGRLALTGCLISIFASWAFLAAAGDSLTALIAGIVLLDLGVQGAQISNQSTIYALRPEAHSRMNTAYMVSLFAGGVLGSLLSASVYGLAGWGAACAVGAVLGACGLAIWAATQGVGQPARVPRAG